jgi:hypothetical protein
MGKGHRYLTVVFDLLSRDVVLERCNWPCCGVATRMFAVAGVARRPGVAAHG